MDAGCSGFRYAQFTWLIARGIDSEGMGKLYYRPANVFWLSLALVVSRF